MKTKISIAVLVLVSLSVSQESNVWISYADFDSAQVYLTTDTVVSGFNFTFQIEDLLELYYIDYTPMPVLDGFTISGSLPGVLQVFSFTGAVVPPGEHHVMTLHWDIQGISGWIYLDGEAEYWLSVCDFIEFEFGDVNGDTILNVLDFVLIVNYILGNIDFSDQQFCTSDMQPDGVIDVLDIIMLLDLLIGP